VAESSNSTSTGLGGFKKVLREYRVLSASAVGSAAVPFVASVASLTPPWPKGIVAVTSLVQLVTLILVYQFLERAPRRKINRIMAVTALLFFGFSVLYLASVSRFVYEAGPKHELRAKGYICTPMGLSMFGADCPDIDASLLRGVEYEPTAVWTPQSVRNVELILVFLWSCAFLSLSTLVGSFVVFQTRGGVRKVGIKK
jgi:hypothetical protein